MIRFAVQAALTVALLFALAVPATAQTQEGLVNVNVSDVTVQAPIAVAANVCDTNVNVLAEQLALGGAECDAQATSDAVFTPEEGPAPNQSGLVNVNVDDVVVQLPIAVAANVCQTNVNVLARQFRAGGAVCDAVADADAG
jgi:hypothetical protein